MKTWIENMDWSFLDDAVAARVWDEARRRYFDDDARLATAFTLALEGEGFKVALNADTVGYIGGEGE